MPPQNRGTRFISPSLRQPGINRPGFEPAGSAPAATPAMQMPGPVLELFGPAPVRDVMPAGGDVRSPIGPIPQGCDETLYRSMFAAFAAALQQVGSRRDTFLRVRTTNGYYAKFAPEGAQIGRLTYTFGNPINPGATAEYSMGGYAVPQNMKLQIRALTYRANRSAGGIHEPIPPGALTDYLGFSVYDNMKQIGAVAFSQSAPTALAATGPDVFSPELLGPTVFPSSVQAGTGDAMAPDHAYYIESGHNVKLTVSATAALPYSIVSCAAVLDVMLLPRDVFNQRIEY